MAEKYPQRAVGAQLRRARIAAGLSQEAVADALGTTRVTVSAWERGLSRPSDRYLAKIARRLDLDPESLRLAADVEQARAEAEVASERLAAAEVALAAYLDASGRHEQRRASR